MFNQHFSVLDNDHSRSRALYLFLIVNICTVLLYGCRSLALEPDCGAMENVNIFGVVKDSDGNPIPGAHIVVNSMNKNKCSNAVPFEEVATLSDSIGNFSIVIPLLSEGELLKITISANGFTAYYREYATYASLRDPLTITLFND
jgi:hypothetical protein